MVWNHTEDHRQKVNVQNGEVSFSTSDKHEDSKENRDLSSHFCISETNYVTESCFNNILIMTNIISYLNVKQLQTCRLTCKQWNKSITAIFLKENYGNGLVIHAELKNNYSDDSDTDSKLDESTEEEEEEEEEEQTWDYEDYSENDNNHLFFENENIERFEELHGIIQTAPENWFRNITLDESIWIRNSFQRIFIDYGNRLQVINITSQNIDVISLQNLLLNWCPNLKQLGIPDINLDDSIILKTFKPLKLTGLSTNFNNISYSVAVEDLAEVVFQILKHSPQIKTLASYGGCTGISKQLFLKLQNFPEILNQLQDLCLTNAFVSSKFPKCTEDAFAALSNMHINPTLKNLTIVNVLQGQGIVINRFLNMLVDSLRTLSVSSSIDSDVHASILHPFYLIKPMKYLKEFRYYCIDQELMNIIDVISDMPNLITFVLGIDCPYSYGIEDDNLDRMLSNSQQIIKTPHKQLQQLYLFGFIHRPKRAFEVINISFPNVNKLFVGIGLKEPKTYAEFSDFFKGIASCKKLNKLFLDLSNFKCYPDTANMVKTMFSYIEPLPYLTHLSIRGAISFDLDINMFANFPKLIRTTLYGVKVDGVRFKMLRNFLENKGVFLDKKEYMWFSHDGVDDLQF